MTPPDEPPSNPYDPDWPKPEQPYGAPSYGGLMAPKHPSATTAMVLGISALVGMFFCGIPIVLAPFAWMMGGRAVKEIDANPGRFSGRDQAQAGRIMGIIGTVLLGLGVIALIAFVTLAFAVSESSDVSYDQDSGYNTSDSSF